MFERVFRNQRALASNDQVENNRLHPRRENDRCALIFGETLVPVRDWSFGGALLDTDERLFSDGQHIVFTLKFKAGDEIHSVIHQGIVIRRANCRVAVKFAPLTEAKQREFMAVMEHCVADEFARSQASA